MHIPVMLSETLQVFREGLRPLSTFLDGTFGRGGHTAAILENFPSARVWALDQDQQSISEGEEKFKTQIQDGRLNLIKSNFLNFKTSIGEKKFDGILLDLGVSSPQLDVAERGFSFYHDGPLDMRMDRSQKITAADIVNGWTEEELLDLFRELGEVRNPNRVVKAIVHDRKTSPFTTTRQLASMMERVCHWQKRGFHPATQYFMALRLQVNQELSVLSEALPNLMKALEYQGRIVVITFHSLEDRIVKNIFKTNQEIGKPVNKKVIKPTRDEMKVNPRSRSAKLRAFERGQQ